MVLSILSHLLCPSLLTLQPLFHPSQCSPLIMFNSPPALPRLTSPYVIPLSALCFRLVLITPPHHCVVWNWLRPDIQPCMRPWSVPSPSIQHSATPAALQTSPCFDHFDMESLCYEVCESYDCNKGNVSHWIDCHKIIVPRGWIQGHWLRWSIEFVVVNEMSQLLDGLPWTLVHTFKFP